MSDLNIYAFEVFLKDLKFKTRQVLLVVDELDMLVFSLRRLSEALSKSCDDISRKV